MTIDTNLHNLDTSELDQYATDWDRWSRMCQGDARHAPTPAELDTFCRVPVVSVDLGDGLARQTVLYPYQEHARDSVQVLGRSEAYTAGGVSIEIDADFVDFKRRVCCIINGAGDDFYTAAEWLRIADLLRRDEVYAALKRWAAEDAAADATT